MKKNLRKLSALLLALVMVLGMSAMAFAAVDPDLGDYEGSNDRGHGVTGSTVNLTKSIVIFNPENTDVREPNIQYVYAVTPVTAAAELGTITDDGRYNTPVGTPVTVQTNEGVAAAITSGTTIKFQDTVTVSAKSTGTVAQHSGSITVDATKFPHAGVYRYLITESVQDHSGNAITDIITYGLEARTTNYEETRYLDLYIVNGSSGLELSSAVVFKTITKDDSNTAATSAITTKTDKTTGFEPGTDPSGTPDYTNDEDVDRYFTYNLKVGKTTTGALADKANKFPFEIKLTGALTPVVKTDLTVSGATGVSAGVQNISTTVLTLSPAMANGEYIELKGIPKGTTVTVKETNNTPDIYTASLDPMTGTTTTDAAVKGYTSADAEKTDLSLASTDYAKNTTAVAIDGGQTVTSGTIGGTYAKTELGFTNNLAEISPTGIALRVAPYVAILCGGIVLLVLTKKRKADEEA